MNDAGMDPPTIALPNAGDSVRGRRVTVMGLGRFGGGTGAVRWLVGQGACVTATDLLPAEKLADSLAELGAAPPARLRLGGHDEADFRTADWVVVNPAVPPGHPLVELARAHGARITSEIELFLERNPGRVVAVTGTNGKSTTTAMAHGILQETGARAWLGGNIGRSLLPVVDEIRSDDWVVLELSSFQLEALAEISNAETPGWARRLCGAVVTNFAANHLDRHGTLDAYRAAKQKLAAALGPESVAVLNDDDPDVAAWPTRGRRLGFGTKDRGGAGLYLVAEQIALFRDESAHETVLALPRWVPVPGRHNLLNALAAGCLALALGAGAAAVERGLRGYRALPHRLQFVGEVHGRRFFNDSLATTPESAIAALDAFEAPVVLLAGGYDKGADMRAFVARIADVRGPVEAVAWMGQLGPKLETLLREIEPRSGRPIVRRVCADFDEACRWSFEQSSPGGVVLLSPGCASFDWFRNFAERGERFANFVNTLSRSPKVESSQST